MHLQPFNITVHNNCGLWYNDTVQATRHRETNDCEERRVQCERETNGTITLNCHVHLVAD